MWVRFPPGIHSVTWHTRDSLGTCTTRTSIDSLAPARSPLAGLRPCRTTPVGSIPAGDTLRDAVRVKAQLSEKFAAHFARVFVVAQAFEGGVAEQTVVGPFGETDLRDDFWLQPAQLGHFFRGDAFAKMTFLARGQIGERTFVREQRAHRFEESRARGRIEALPDFAGEYQLAVLIIPRED